MKKTKIDWCDSTWNPVTGCLHGCEYCYARKIAERFGGVDPLDLKDEEENFQIFREYAELDRPLGRENGQIAPYPYGFKPTFHRYRLDEPARWTKSRTIFVCSMADLFGDWVPDEWIGEVFEACGKAPQHRYLFLTKNPKRYDDLYKVNELRNLGATKGVMFGFTLDKAHDKSWYDEQGQRSFVNEKLTDKFVSIEPITGPLSRSDLNAVRKCAWVIIGAETGNRKDKIIPDRNWIYDIVLDCRESRIPVFMKESLRDLMGDDFRQEFPWEVEP